MNGDTICCRAKKSPDCYDGKPVLAVYEASMDEDATWDGESVVCDSCYIALGQPSVPFGSPGALDFPAEIAGGKGRPPH